MLTTNIQQLSCRVVSPGGDAIYSSTIVFEYLHTVQGVSLANREHDYKVLPTFLTEYFSPKNASRPVFSEILYTAAWQGWVGSVRWGMNDAGSPRKTKSCTCER